MFVCYKFFFRIFKPPPRVYKLNMRVNGTMEMFIKKIETNKSASGHVSDQISNVPLRNYAGGGQR